MRKARILIVLAAMIAATMVLLPSSHAAGPNEAVVTDASSDGLSRFFPNYRNSYAEDSPQVPQLDVRSASMSTTDESGNKFITFKAKVGGPLPVPGALAAGPQGFPAGVGGMTFYFTWATDQNQPGGNSMTVPQATSLTCGDAYAQQKIGSGYAYRIEYNENADSGNINGCRYATEGPFHPVDGWTNNILVSIAPDAAGNIAYTWDFGRYDAIEGITWTFPGSHHDLVECSDINPGTFTCSEPSFGTGPGQVPHDIPATLNGARYYKNGTRVVGSAWPGGTGYSADELVLKVPYLYRDDFKDDDNGKADETRVRTMLAPGDQVTGFTSLLGAAFSVNIPPGDPLCYGSTLYGISPIFDENEIILKDECFSYSAGNTFTADWAPGNPFVNMAGAQPGVPGVFGRICLTTACNANWGGYIIGDGTSTNVGSYQPGLGAPFCRYPLGYEVGSVPSGVTTRTVDDPLGGGTVKLGNTGGGPLITQPYPAVPHDPDGGDPGVTVGLPTGGNNPCGHTRDSHSSNFNLVGTGTSFTAI